MSKKQSITTEYSLKNVAGDLYVFYLIVDQKLVYEHEWCSTCYSSEIGIKFSEATKEKLEEIKERMIAAYELTVKSFYEAKAKEHLEINVQEIQDFFDRQTRSDSERCI